MLNSKPNHLRLVISNQTPAVVSAFSSELAHQRLPIVGSPSSFASAAQNHLVVRRLLKAVLNAKLAPDCTIEDACHLGVVYEGDPVPRLETFLDDVKAVRNVGLDMVCELDGWPCGIVMKDPHLFRVRFPELEAAIPVMLVHGGVQPYTDGLPRIPPPPAVPESVRRQLKAVLGAKLTRSVTVEEACHMDLYVRTNTSIPPTTIRAHERHLIRAGLRKWNCGREPWAIQLVDPVLFIAKFPTLESAVPLMQAYGGVQPYTDGLPAHAPR